LTEFHDANIVTVSNVFNARGEVMTKRCRTILSPQSTPSPEHRYLRISEAAAYLAATEWFVYTLTWTKAIPFAKLGKRLVLDRVDLDTYMQNAKSGTA
jgi:excisionase family DNA binding protein